MEEDGQFWWTDVVKAWTPREVEGGMYMYCWKKARIVHICFAEKRVYLAAQFILFSAPKDVVATPLWSGMEGLF